MNTLIHADIFFFISTIGLIIFIILGIVALIYMIGILKSVRAVSRKLEDGVAQISSEAKDFLQDVRESTFYRFVFGKKRSGRN